MVNKVRTNSEVILGMSVHVCVLFLTYQDVSLPFCSIVCISVRATCIMCAGVSGDRIEVEPVSQVKTFLSRASKAQKPVSHPRHTRRREVYIAAVLFSFR